MRTQWHAPDTPTSSGVQGLPPRCHHMPRCDPHARHTHTHLPTPRGTWPHCPRKGSQAAIGHPSPPDDRRACLGPMLAGGAEGHRPRRAGKNLQGMLAEQPSVPSGEEGMASGLQLGLSFSTHTVGPLRACLLAQGSNWGAGVRSKGTWGTWTQKLCLARMELSPSGRDAPSMGCHPSPASSLGPGPLRGPPGQLPPPVLPLQPLGAQRHANLPGYSGRRCYHGDSWAGGRTSLILGGPVTGE